MCCAPCSRWATPPSAWPAVWSASSGIGPLSIPLGAPNTFETPVCAERAVAFAELDMALVRVLKDRFGSTINDVVLAVCSGALRTHLVAHDQDVESPLVAVVPVSVRGEEGVAVGNQLSAMFVPLANDRQTPLERLRTVTAASASCKGQERAVGYGPMATLMADAIPPALAKPAIQLGVRSGVLRKVRAGNLMVSNVPGPHLPALLRRHAAARGVPARAGGRRRRAQRDRAELPRLALRRNQRVRDRRARPAGSRPGHGRGARPAVPDGDRGGGAEGRAGVAPPPRRGKPRPPAGSTGRPHGVVAANPTTPAP